MFISAARSRQRNPAPAIKDHQTGNAQKSSWLMNRRSAGRRSAKPSANWNRRLRRYGLLGARRMSPIFRRISPRSSDPQRPGRTGSRPGSRLDHRTNWNTLNGLRRNQRIYRQRRIRIRSSMPTSVSMTSPSCQPEPAPVDIPGQSARIELRFRSISMHYPGSWQTASADGGKHCRSPTVPWPEKLLRS